jgi:cytochrome c oxidase assembly factor 1
VDKTGFRWSRTLPLFVAVIACASVAIFNYQKLSSPVVSSTLYALRTSPKARAYLGDEIYFKQQIPWISGEMNQLHGRIDISFSVKGTKNTGVMRFASYRPTARGLFETTEWSLETTDGKKIDLLEGNDIFKGIVNGRVDDDFDEAPVSRGFRQELKK